MNHKKRLLLITSFIIISFISIFLIILYSSNSFLEKNLLWIFLILITIFIYIIGLTKKKNTSNTITLGQQFLNANIKNLNVQDKKKNFFSSETFIDFLSACIPIITIILIVTKILLITIVADNTMNSKYEKGNIAIFNRLAYTRYAPERGDVIVFWRNDRQTMDTSRIIGLPGDYIEFRDGYVVINNEYCDESAYLGDDVETNSSLTFVVPYNSYFVLDDNRMGANDSRHWLEPFVYVTSIKGKYMGQLNCNIK